MPRKRITFIVIPPNDGQVQEFRFSSKLLWILGIACVAFIGALGYYASGYYASGYYSRSDQYALLQQYEEENDELDDGLTRTTKRLGELELAMELLIEEDEELRAWHEMDPLSAEERLGGMGGTEDLPEDYTVLPERKRTLLTEIGSKIVQLQYQTKLQEESFNVIRGKFLENEENLKLLPSISPVPPKRTRRTSGFGKRDDPFTGQPRFHMGVDFAGRLGTHIYATADGVVKYSYEDTKRLGNVVVIVHDAVGVNGEETYTIPGVYRTEYGHLQKRLVKKGDRVKRGQKIGTLGNTGRSTGPHLHYAVKYQDKRRSKHTKGYTDPDPFILDDSGDERVAGWLPGVGN